MAVLSSLGIFHTTISLMAVASGAIALIRDIKITWNNTIGKIFVTTTVITCLTGFGIFHHGGFGKPHVLGIITLIVLAVAVVAGKNSKPLGRFSPYIETIAYSMTFFFHLIPGITETTTRLPVDHPLATDPGDPIVTTSIGICFIAFLIGATLQVIQLRRKLKSTV
jgi:uncharacterized membrane protein